MNKKLIAVIAIPIIIFIVAVFLYVYGFNNNKAPLFDDMGRQLAENFLRENDIKVSYEMVSGGSNFYKYFKEDREVTKANGFAEDLLPSNLKKFITENCPQKLYTPNSDGKISTFSRYMYKLKKDPYDFKFIEIIVDEPATEVVCYWMGDKKTGNYEKIPGSSLPDKGEEFVGDIVDDKNDTGVSAKTLTQDQVLSVYFENKSAKVSFMYPSGFVVGSNEMGAEPMDAAWIYIAKEGFGTSYFDITGLAMPSLDEEAVSFNPNQYDPKEVEKWDTKKIAEAIWDMNFNSKNPYIKDNVVSNLEETVMDGKTAYKFSVTTSYNDWSIQESLNEETTYIFVRNNSGNILKIYYPTNNEVSRKILDSVIFN